MTKDEALQKKRMFIYDCLKFIEKNKPDCDELTCFATKLCNIYFPNSNVFVINATNDLANELNDLYYANFFLDDILSYYIKGKTPYDKIENQEDE